MSDPKSPAVPFALARGVPMIKISSKKMKQVIMRLNDGCISWAGSNYSKVPINQIRELRLGQPPDDAGLTSSRWITIVYVRGKEWKILHMISLTDDVHEQWVSTLRHLVSETSERAVSEVKPADPDMLWIRQLWPGGKEKIEMSVAVGLCRSIGLEVPKSLQTSYKDTLDLSDFRQLVKDAQTRPEIEALHSRLSSGGELDRAKVSRFLTQSQGIEAGDLFDQYSNDGVWSVESLSDFLASNENATSREQDLTKPLPEYFISSSHNTYLVGEQWRGESTVEGYIRVLLAGCRCVELDCHDGETEPEVYHKLTLTSRVSVREICKAIDKYAFIASPLPLIISAEVHCSHDQQIMLAKIMKTVWGDKLVTEPIDGRDDLPSPEDLKCKILFKTKPKAEAPPPEPSPRFSPNQPYFRDTPTDVQSTTSDSESDSALTKLARRLSFGAGSSDSSASSPRTPRKSFSEELKDLLVYTAGVKYRGFSKLVDYKPHQQFSVSDRTAEKILKESKNDWIKHNFSHLTRVYPKGARLRSSNYDPRPIWNAGNQLVALNWQTIDQATILNNALFADTQGYVLKPMALRSKITEIPIKCNLKIEIISAQRLPLSSDLYVEGQIDNEEQKTSVVKGTSIAPIWNDTFEWSIYTKPSMLELTFMRLEIRSKVKDGTIAQWARPISAIPKGYRYLPLYDGLFSKFVFATLFVRVSMEVHNQDTK